MAKPRRLQQPKGWAFGFCVAVADQTETPAVADGLVKREVTQLITPGTVTDEKLLRPDANYLAAVATGEGYGLTLLDVSTGEFRGTLLYSKSALFDAVLGGESLSSATFGADEIRELLGLGKAPVRSLSAVSG